MRRIKIRIYGDVQGVNFREEAKQEADDLDLGGIVVNEPDGTVYIEAEGEDEDLEQFLKWCSIGPEIAKVMKVESEFSEETVGYVGFSVKESTN